MPTRRHTTAAVTAAIALLAAIAGTSLNATPAHAAGDEPAAVARAVDALTKAMVEVDKPKLEALTSPHLSYGHSAGRVENQRQFVDYLVSRASAFRFINLSDQSVSIAGDAAIARHILTGETVDKEGKATPVRIGVLQVWQKHSEEWKLLARQAYRL
jgi:ketosteroid isomerase-like protein